MLEIIKNMPIPKQYSGRPKSAKHQSFVDTLDKMESWDWFFVPDDYPSKEVIRNWIFNYQKETTDKFTLRKRENDYAVFKL